MNNSDSYKTIAEISEGSYSELRSKFIAFALPVQTAEEVKEKVDAYRKQFYDARHICWAYMLGADRKQFRVNDDGEPSSTAGKPILGVINSNELTDILIVVVRYFGGVKLGTSGLIAAYKAAAQDAVINAEIVTRTVDERFTLVCEYAFVNGIMKIIKDLSPTVVSQKFDMNCEFILQIRKNDAELLRQKLLKVETARIIK
ncbi:MAG: YigZ family protein [Dysgonamonadaceae bacterium]|jgi:uncharacterized YigZ family protein|nr:YigZ family protein [Dysgonamonadaceae bacterium]